VIFSNIEAVDISQLLPHVTDELGKHMIQWKNPDAKHFMLYDSVFMQSLKNKQVELRCWEIQIWVKKLCKKIQ
jgi:hypothetical protein